MTKPRNDDASPLVNPLENRLGYQLRRTSALLMADLGVRLAPMELRPSDVAVLLVILANTGCQQGAVADLLGIKPANMVPLIARLVQQGLVDRTRVDGRSHALSLTAKGRARTAAVGHLLQEHESEFQSRLDQAELARLFASLTTLRD